MALTGVRHLQSVQAFLPAYEMVREKGLVLQPHTGPLQSVIYSACKSGLTV